MTKGMRVRVKSTGQIGIIESVSDSGLTVKVRLLYNAHVGLYFPRSLEII